MSLDNVFGQDYAVNLLLNDLKTGNVKHSYIFYGVKGVGKKFTAVQFIKSLMCENPQQWQSCDNCDTCKKIDSNTHPDFIIVDFDFQERLLEKVEKTYTISIDTIRYVKQFCSLTTYSGKYKAVIIDSAETLQKDAANSLLKLLEEPPKNCIIILITTSIGLLPKTVLSRCQHVKFSPLKKEIVNTILQKTGLLTEELILGCIEEVEYLKRTKTFRFDLQNISLFDLFIFSDTVAEDKEFTKYFLIYLVEKFLSTTSDVLDKEKFSFLEETENYIKQLRYNIDYKLLLPTFISRFKQVCKNVT